MQLISAKDRVHISALREILLTAGNSYLKIDTKGMAAQDFITKFWDSVSGRSADGGEEGSDSETNPGDVPPDKE